MSLAPVEPEVTTLTLNMQAARAEQRALDHWYRRLAAEAAVAVAVHRMATAVLHALDKEEMGGNMAVAVAVPVVIKAVPLSVGQEENTAVMERRDM